MSAWRIVLAAGLTMTAAAGCAGAQEPGTAPRVRPLAGSRDRPGLFTQRLTLPAGSCGPVHTHTSDLHGLVMRGTLLFGIADSTGRIAVRSFPAGSFVPVSAGQPHLEGSIGETEIHLSGVGPVQTTVVDSADPRRCETVRGR